MSDISEGYEIIPQKRLQEDALPSIPDPCQVGDQMESLATTIYSNEVAPPGGEQEYPQMGRVDTDPYPQSYNPAPSTHARYSDEFSSQYRPQYNDGIQPGFSRQRALAPSYSNPYSTDTRYPPYPDNPSYRMDACQSQNTMYSQQPESQNAYSPPDPQDAYNRQRQSRSHTTYSRQSYPSSTYLGQSGSENYSDHRHTMYERQSNAPNPYGGGQPEPENAYGRQPPSTYNQQSNPPNPYGGGQPETENAYGRQPPSIYNQQSNPPNPYGGGQPEPENAYGRQPPSTYNQQSNPPNPYGGGQPEPENAYGRQPPSTYNRQAEPSNPYGGGQPEPENAYGPHPDSMNAHHPRPHGSTYDQQSDPTNQYDPLPEPQYAQVRKPAMSSSSAPKLSKNSFDQNIPQPRFGAHLPPTQLLKTNAPICSDMPPPRHSNHHDLPLPRMVQTSNTRFPAPDSYSYREPNANYNLYSEYSNHTLPSSDYRDAQCSAQNRGFRSNTQYRQSYMEEKHYGGDHSLPPPQRVANVNDQYYQSNIRPDPNRDYYQRNQPAAPYSTYPNTQHQDSNLYESIGSGTGSYSKVSGDTAYDPNCMPYQGGNPDVNPSALPQPKIPPGQNPGFKTVRSKPDLKQISRGLEEVRLPTERPPRTSTPPPPNWECPMCTFANKPTRPGCEICSAARPDDYIVPPGYELDEDELMRQKNADQHEIEQQEKLLLERERNYNAMMQAADQDLIEVDEEFECPICIVDVDVGDGVRLRECLHAFCRDCLSLHIIHADDAEVKCPFQGETYQCQSVVTEREVKQLLSPEQYKHWQQMGLNQAEGTIQNAFHCKTADCAGWCVYEDDINFFHCPVCDVQNCLTCKAIHEGKNCKEYQQEIVSNAKNDEDAKRTQKMLEDMIKEGEAMKCPKCDVIIQKKLGCDWIRCTVCKTEICWATKGHRWGPKGKGDTTGGCKCRADGRTPCCPECRNCH